MNEHSKLLMNNWVHNFLTRSRSQYLDVQIVKSGYEPSTLHGCI